MIFGVVVLEPMDRFLADYYPVLALLLGLTLAIMLIRTFTRGGSALGDYLDQRGIFNVTISRRPRTRTEARRYAHAARHPPPRLSTGRALFILALLSLGLAIFVAWFMYGLYLSLPLE
jgi:hypothetical protein